MFFHANVILIPWKVTLSSSNFYLKSSIHVSDRLQISNKMSVTLEKYISIPLGNWQFSAIEEINITFHFCLKLVHQSFHQDSKRFRNADMTLLLKL